ncbi:gephyrin-like molybdotransferase Glp [Desulforhabdus sp. TSK]|uniref:molybdopterin molybdotransferase MoeA n=1 Tax=Desulforhabdus sp. TSK TaxID=2925014 RepID=UPI001FC892CE|nr:gephyrin-like molybdotransferase Glp [Desulforhabdus sp. TSK]GKT06828.1 molybdopterin molybdenumtransferase MoeA [Desulforhabdus sp. TSK]
MLRMSLGLKEALSLTLEEIKPLAAEEVALVESIDRVAASDLYALVDSPSMDSSRKDGYAVLSHEVAHATAEKPVRLRLLGSLAAGEQKDISLKPGTAIKVLTGSRIPTGADAVVAEEFVKAADSEVVIEASAEPRNILRRGSDVASGRRILERGREISPIMAGLLAAAGHDRIPVFRNPVVGIIGTGDEIVEPGKPLGEGKLYASNIITVAGWCRRYGMKTRLATARDDHEALFNVIKILSEETDAVITSGGAWTGDRDMVGEVLDELGWRKVFHRIRVGPGKAIGFGLLEQKPVFILAGGPPSNLMGFLQIALPGILSLGGHANPELPRLNARLAFDIRESDPDWTDFFFGTLESTEALPYFHPMSKRSRLSSIVKAAAIVRIPEGQDCLREGSIVEVQLLR